MRVRCTHFNAYACHHASKLALTEENPDDYISEIEGEVIATHVGGFWSSAYFLIKTDYGDFIKVLASECKEVKPKDK